jgi:hypothetical protein
MLKTTTSIAVLTETELQRPFLEFVQIPDPSKFTQEPEFGFDPGTRVSRGSGWLSRRSKAG